MSDRLRGCISNPVDPEDRLSTLPADVLLHILSFLDTTKEVVRTCTLSKRWQFMWTGISRINFRICLNKENPKPKIIDGVSKMLAMCSDLKHFGVDIYGPKIVECFSSIDTWIECLIIKNTVESILLFLFGQYELPQMLFSYTSLKNLYVHGCVIMNPQGDIRWICLTRLRVEGCYVSDNFMEKMLSGCPVLEYLSLKNVKWGLRSLNITSRKLTTLVIDDYYKGDAVEVSAPYVRNFSIWMTVKEMRFRFKNLSSIVRGSIGFYDPVIESDQYTSPELLLYIKDVFQSLKSAKELDLEDQCIEVLSMLEMKGWILPPIPTRLCLNLTTISHEGSIPGIIGILKSSPCLETLVIEGRDISFYVKEGDKDLITRDSALAYLASDNIDFVLNHLKIIKIYWFKGKQMPILVQFLLKNAKVLQKMVITDSVEFPSDLASRLLTFPRASAEAVVIFE